MNLQKKSCFAQPMSTPNSLDILFVGTLPPYPGGSALSSGQLIAGFAEHGHTVRAVAPLKPVSTATGDPFAVAHPRLSIERFPVASYDFDHTNPLGEVYRQNERAAVRARVSYLIESRRPDVMMSGRESFAIHAADLANGAGIPFVLRAAGGMTTELLDGTLPTGLADGLREAYRRADVIASPAEHMAQRLRTELGLRHACAIRNGVNLEMFAPRPKPAMLRQELGITDDAVVVLHASNLVASKRPLDIVASAPAVLRTDSRVLYVIVGDGPLRPAMEVACREYNVADRFRFVGWVNYEQMPAYMNLADIVTHPAQAEAQARVYLEAQASACVLLASDIPAAREVIDDGESGIFHRCGDVADLTRQILRATSEPDWRADVGRRARMCVHAHDMRDAVSAYLTLFAQLRSRPNFSNQAMP